MPNFANGNTQLYHTTTLNGAEQVYGRNLTFVDDSIIYWFNNQDGRQKVPLFGWLWRGTLYFWSFVFAFAYAIYAKKRESMIIIVIPFMYMLTCMLGPVSWLRYIYVNIACLPLAFFAVLYRKNTDGKV